MIILINALGITDSGGITVFQKVLQEFSSRKDNKYYFICNKGDGTIELARQFQGLKCFHFVFLNRGFFRRLYYEFFLFPLMLKKHNVDLVYNFSGSSQRFLFSNVSQVLKIQNLLFYSRALDICYLDNKKYFLWVRQIFLKRIIYKYMLSRVKNIEIQSKHVKNYLSDYINIKNKKFYIKSDIDVSDSAFYAPRQYNFSKKIKFLYIVGPHFEILHKNLQDFINAMLNLTELGVDFEINITLTNDQLNNSKVWDASLNSKTNFLGYVSDQEKLTKLFCNNTILISTSIIETLGLHVIEGIKNGVVTIVPNEPYASEVYGENMFRYELFNMDSLVSVILSVINYKESYSEKILTIQDDLRKSEISKIDSILNIFDEVINVQK